MMPERGVMAVIQVNFGYGYVDSVIMFKEHEVDQNDPSMLVRFVLKRMQSDLAESFECMLQDQSEHDEDPDRYVNVTINGEEFVVDLKDPNEIEHPNNLCHDTPTVERDGCKPSACRLESCS